MPLKKFNVRLSTTAIFGDLGGYVIENFRDTLNDLGKQYYMTICYPYCRPANDCKMDDLE